MPKNSTPSQISTRKTRVAGIKAGHHPQKWRLGVAGARKRMTSRGAQLGPMGPLGPNIIMQLALTDFGRKTVEQQARLRSGANLSAVWRTLERVINDDLIQKLTPKINEWVPKDTGRLREAIQHSLVKGENKEKEDLKTGRYIIALDTAGIPYANPVNNMPSSWLQHPGHHLYNKGRKLDKNGKKVDLEDENAQKGWFNLLLVMGRNIARSQFGIFVREIALLLGGPYQYNNARKMFTVRFSN